MSRGPGRQSLIYNELLVLFSFFFQPLKKVCFQTEILGNLFKHIFFCFLLLFTSSSPCRKDQFAVSFFFTPLYKPYRHELISYPDLTLFYTLSIGRGRSGYEIRHEPLQRVSFFAPFWSELIRVQTLPILVWNQVWVQIVCYTAVFSVVTQRAAGTTLKTAVQQTRVQRKLRECMKVFAVLIPNE